MKTLKSKTSILLLISLPLIIAFGVTNSFSAERLMVIKINVETGEIRVEDETGKPAEVLKGIPEEEMRVYGFRGLPIVQTSASPGKCFYVHHPDCTYRRICK